jgi:radical SAM superfamily enzyme YgiQ (UPF0313 family)
VKILRPLVNENHENLTDLRGILRQATPGSMMLLNPPQFPPAQVKQETAVNKGYSTYPPNGLFHLMAAMHLADSKLKVRIHDLHLRMIQLGAEGEKDILAKLRQDVLELCAPFERPLVGINFMFATSEDSAFELSDWLHELGAIVVYGGVQSTFDFQRILELGKADIVVRFEAEETIQRILELWNASELPEQLDLYNVCFRKDGVVKSFPTRSERVVPSSITSYLAEVDVDAYSRYGSLSFITKAVAPDGKYFTVNSNRGCRAQCTFCSVASFNGRGVRRRTVDDVLEEIRFLVEEKGVTVIDWLDDDLLYQKEETLDLFRKMAERFGTSIKWVTNNAVIAAALDDELIQAASDSGCVHLGFGVESGNEIRLREIKKPSTKQRVRAVYETLKSNRFRHIYRTANIMVGFPGETLSELVESYAFALELENDWTKVCITQPLKGTAMYSVFAGLGDPRVLTNRADNYTMGRQIQREGSSAVFDFSFGTDVFSRSLDWVPSYGEIKQLWYLLTANINFIYNVNLTGRGDPEKFLRLALPLTEMYPHDPLIWASISEAYKMTNDQDRAAHFLNMYHAVRAKQPDLVEVFNAFDLERIFDSRERETRASAFGNNRDLLKEYAAAIHGPTS